jgi:hypothetical protein
VVWSPDGKQLATSSDDQTVKVWPAAGDAEPLTIRGHTGASSSVAWSPDGQVIVSGGVDRTILVHDAAAGYLAVRSPQCLPTVDRRLAVDPKNRADWRLRAEIHARMEDWDEAAADLRQYLTLKRDKRWFTLDCWVVGPYPEDLKVGYAPENTPNPCKPVAGPGAAEYSALLTWRSMPLTAQGFMDFGQHFGNAEHISAYAMLRIYSPEKQPVAILLGSDDYVRLSLNGKTIHERLVARGAMPDEDAIPATLEPGWNTLLARVVNVTGEHALYWRLSNAPADLLRARNEAR